MDADRERLHQRVGRLEEELWRAGREADLPAFSPGFEAGVMRRIREERAARAPQTFLELVGGYCWRLAPAAAVVLILVTALGFFLPAGSGRGWSGSLNGGDIFIRWMLSPDDSGGRP